MGMIAGTRSIADLLCKEDQGPSKTGKEGLGIPSLFLPFLLSARRGSFDPKGTKQLANEARTRSIMLGRQLFLKGTLSCRGLAMAGKQPSPIHGNLARISDVIAAGVPILGQKGALGNENRHLASVFQITRSHGDESGEETGTATGSSSGQLMERVGGRIGFISDFVLPRSGGTREKSVHPFLTRDPVSRRNSAGSRRSIPGMLSRRSGLQSRTTQLSTAPQGRSPLLTRTKSTGEGDRTDRTPVKSVPLFPKGDPGSAGNSAGSRYSIPEVLSPGNGGQLWNNRRFQVAERRFLRLTGTKSAGELHFFPENSGLSLSTDSAKVTQRSVLIEQISQAVYMAATRHAATTKILINGDDLGRIEIRFVQEEGGSRATIAVEWDSTRMALQKALPSIIESLSEKGISMNSLEIQTNDSRREKPSDGQGGEKARSPSVEVSGEVVQAIHPSIGTRHFGYNTMELVA